MFFYLNLVFKEESPEVSNIYELVPHQETIWFKSNMCFSHQNYLRCFENMLHFRVYKRCYKLSKWCRLCLLFTYWCTSLSFLWKVLPEPILVPESGIFCWYWVKGSTARVVSCYFWMIYSFTFFSKVCCFEYFSISISCSRHPVTWFVWNVCFVTGDKRYLPVLKNMTYHHLGGV